ncbi:hypothetical protein DAEQUDRAFT_728885 [Daedalea quercina L-15889]|uniref:Uncharacterized protein n=1 Tax=Daedalea quercina L-15889 TaxID=1314783 RepID=A0A165P1J6_9APHY|nr:hypothetical protein DAEQUDRAFT_728885 [Daedalea quercina L-15889]
MGPDHDAILLSDSEPERRRTFSETIAIIEDLRAQLDAQRPESVLANLREGRALAAIDQAGPRMPGAGEDALSQPQTHRTSTLTGTAPLRFGPRSESSTGPSRPSLRRPLFESHLRAQREASSSTDSSTTLGRRVAARAAGAQSGRTRTDRGASFNDLMEDLRREMPGLMDIGSGDREAREREAHLISQHNANINTLVHDARAFALGIPIDPELAAPAERTDSDDFPSPVSSSWFSPNPAALTAAHSSLSTDSTDGTTLPTLGPVRRSRGSSEARPTFAEQMAQLNADMERQRDRQSRLLARMAARQSTTDVSTTVHNESRASRARETSARENAEQRTMESRLADALDTYGGSNASSFEALRNFAMREPAIASDLEDDDPFSWLMPSRTPPARDGESRRTGRSIWPTSNSGRASQTASSFPYPDTVGVFTGRPRRDRGAQAGVVPASGRGDVSANATSSRRRRRGWARLDHDGDEIPTDEEEEYERTRAQMRTRALQLTASQPAERLRRGSSTVLPPPLPPPPPPGRRLSFVPTTQPLFWPSPNGDTDARVRINPAREISTADLDRPITPRDESDEEECWKVVPPVPQTIGSSAPFVPSLLPLPRVDLSQVGASARRATKAVRIADPMPIYCAGR